MLDAEKPCCSRHLLQLEPEAGLLPPLARCPTSCCTPPPAVRAPAFPPMVLWVMPLCGSPAPAPIGAIYDANPDPDGGLLTAASTFFSHQGHQAVHDPCPDLAAYLRDLGGLATIILIDHLPDHILLSGLELMEGFFAPSPVDILGVSFMAAYLSSPPPINTTSGASLQGPRSSGDPSSASPLAGGVGFGGQPMGGVPKSQGLVSVGGLPRLQPLGAFLPTSSSVGSTGVNGLTLGGVPHARGWAGLVPSSASSFPGHSSPNSTSSPMLRAYRSLHLAHPPHVGSSPPLGMSTVGNLGFWGSSLDPPLPPAASPPPQLHHPNPNKEVLPTPCPLPSRGGSWRTSSPLVVDQSRVLTPPSVVVPRWPPGDWHSNEVYGGIRCPPFGIWTKGTMGGVLCPPLLPDVWIPHPPLPLPSVMVGGSTCPTMTLRIGGAPWQMTSPHL
jgi:hypothetical protein